MFGNLQFHQVYRKRMKLFFLVHASMRLFSDDEFSKAPVEKNI